MKIKAKTENATLLAVLKKNKRDHYRVNGVEAWIDHGTEKAKAKKVEAPEPDESAD